MSSQTVYLLVPEMVLALSATLIYLGGAFLPSRRGWSWMATSAVLLAAVALFRQLDSSAGPDDPLAVDAFSQLFRWTALAVSLVFALLVARYSEQGESSEFMGSLLLIVAGLMLLALSRDLVMVFAALELISIPTYVLLFLGRDKGQLEAGTKYFFLSILSSGILLYGFSFLYGAAGSTHLTAIQAALAAAGPQPSGVAAFAPLALILIFAGLAFRLTAVPFHFYAPDVYQGTTNPNAGLLSVVPKIAALIALVRITFVAMPGLEQLGWQLSLVLAMVTMTLGNLLALWQNNLRRLLAYSAIAHAGYMLIGLAVGFAVAAGADAPADLDGIAATTFYLLAYAAATTGTFAALTYLSSPERPTSHVNELAGLAENFPRTAAAIAVFMFSLTGIPPLAGFWGKLTLFSGALSVDAPRGDSSGLWSWFAALAIVGALNAAISAGYYLRIVGVMYFRPATERPDAQGGAGAAWATALCAILVLIIGLSPGPLIAESQRASRAAGTAVANVPSAAPVARHLPKTAEATLIHQ